MVQEEYFRTLSSDQYRKMNICATIDVEFDVEEVCKDKPPAAGPYMWSRVIALVILFIVIILGILGNCLTLAALATTKHLRKRVSTILVMNLSTADLSYCILAMPFIMMTYWTPDYWCNHPDLCSYTAYLRYCCGFLDWSCLGVVALERYAKIVHGNSRFYFFVFGRKKVVFTVILALWVFHFSFLLLYLEDTSLGRFGYNPQVHRCDFYPKSNFQYARRVNFIIWACPILVVIGASYLHIYIYTKKRSREVLLFTESNTSNWQSSSSSRQRIQERDITLARTLFILVCSYTFCVMPVSLANILDYCDQYPDLQTLAYCAYYPLYCVNNIIYAICHPEYRVAYFEFIHRWFPQWASEPLCKRFQCSCTSTLQQSSSSQAMDTSSPRYQHYRPNQRNGQNLCLEKRNSEENFLRDNAIPNNSGNAMDSPRAAALSVTNGLVHHELQVQPLTKSFMSVGFEHEVSSRLKRQSAIRRRKRLRGCSSGPPTSMTSRSLGMIASRKGEALMFHNGNRAMPPSPLPPYTPTQHLATTPIRDLDYSCNHVMMMTKAALTNRQSASTDLDEVNSRCQNTRPADEEKDTKACVWPLEAHDQSQHLDEPILCRMSSSMLQIGDIEIQTTSTIKLPPSSFEVDHYGPIPGYCGPHLVAVPQTTKTGRNMAASAGKT